ncbi:MAG: hypothetical protein QM708_12100 [Propioniciclava sp.]|uniref:VG15 protein n=1 Tax=Propioniciclava sp. TaxID=2038686 RepID=UPI0039E62DB6
MAPPDLLIRQHRTDQIRNGVLAAALTIELGHLFLAGQLTRDEFVGGLVASDKLTHDAAVRTAARFITALREAEDADGVLVEAEFDGGASYGRAIGAVRDLDAAQARLDERDWDAEFRRIIEHLALRADLAAKNSGRRTIVESAEASGRAWRRVSDGNPCTFCAMLIGRGPVYRSAASAGAVVGSERRHARHGVQEGRGRTRGTQGLGEKYHTSCGCTVVEQIGTWTPTAEEQHYVDAYDAAVASISGPADATKILSHMREHGEFNDSPKTQTGGAGGGGNPPRRGAGPFKEMGDPPDRDDRAAWSTYWIERQNATGVDFKGEYLESHEVELVERLLRAGQSIEWIQRRRSIPTSDFVWVNHGVPVEAKSTKAKYETIRARIADAVRRAARHGVAKEYFVIDLGAEPLTPELRAALANYNHDRSRYAIRRLWVLSSDGDIEEITLA